MCCIVAQLYRLEHRLSIVPNFCWTIAGLQQRRQSLITPLLHAFTLLCCVWIVCTSVDQVELSQKRYKNSYQHRCRKSIENNTKMNNKSRNIIPRSMQNKSMIWKMTYILFSKIYVHLGFDRDSSHEAEGYRLTEQTNDQTKESAGNSGDSFSDDWDDNATYPHTSFLHLSPRYCPSE